MTPLQRLDSMLRARMGETLRAYRDDDSCPSIGASLPRAVFDAWADDVELPCGDVSDKKSGDDGIYVLPDAEGWLVFERQGGIHVGGERLHANYREAKRAALWIAFSRMLRGAG